MISSYGGENKEFKRAYLAGELEVEFCPHGTLARALPREAGTASPASIPRTGVDTLVAKGKEVKNFDGRGLYLRKRRIFAVPREHQEVEGQRGRQFDFPARPRATSTSRWRPRRRSASPRSRNRPVGSLDPDEHPPARYLCKAPRPRRAAPTRRSIPHDAPARDRVMRGVAPTAAAAPFRCASAPAEVATARLRQPLGRPRHLQNCEAARGAAISLRFTRSRRR